MILVAILAAAPFHLPGEPQTSWAQATIERLQKILALIDEPALSSLPTDSRVYRFTWLPPFKNARIVCVRIQAESDHASIASKSVAWDYEGTYRIVARSSAALDQAAWQDLTEELKAGFWTFSPEP